MKKQLIGTAVIAGLFLVACGNNSDTADTSTDSSSTTSTTAGTENTTSTTTTTQSSTTDYAAMADSFQRNSEAGRYYDARTGKPIKISVDRTTGRKTNMADNQEITRYVYNDNNDWWVYDAEGTRLGRAKMQNNKMMFEGENNTWVDYDSRWKVDEDGDAKLKTDDMKVKVEKDGDMKIKTEDKKIKVEDGKVKEKDN